VPGTTAGRTRCSRSWPSPCSRRSCGT
jgi:hypothetical protein